MTEKQAKRNVVEVAAKYVGYKEKATNRDLDSFEGNAGKGNWTRFGRDVDACSGWMNSRKNGYEWCATFVCAVFLEAFGYPLARNMLYQPERSLAAGCGYAAQYFKNHGAYYKKPELGDQVFFVVAGGIGHTGIVEQIGDSWVQTIEGNSKNMVARHVYNLNDSYIAGYGRPNWALAASVEAPPDQPVERPMLKFGSRGTDVKFLQSMLLQLGEKLPKYGADGDFGSETEAAVKSFQKKNKLEVDGIVGPKTWAKIDELAAKTADQNKLVREDENPYIIYTVKKGDTLTKIAAAHNSTVQALKMLNGIQNANLIQIGQKIKIPY